MTIRINGHVSMSCRMLPDPHMHAKISHVLRLPGCTSGRRCMMEDTKARCRMLEDMNAGNCCTINLPAQLQRLYAHVQ